jgi:hypothetical protein
MLRISARLRLRHHRHKQKLSLSLSLNLLSSGFSNRQVAEKDDMTMCLLKEIERGKHRLIVPVLSFGEIKVGMYRIGGNTL